MKSLVFIGDSLTQWFDWQTRFPRYRVTNLGISGETVQGLLLRRERIRSQIDSPDYIFLMTGINNIANEQYDIVVPYREIVRNLATWHKEATIVVQSILPVDLTWISNTVIKDTNRRIAAIAAEYGAAYLDVFELFIDAEGIPKPGYLSDDGVHLASRGYTVWSEAIERFLNSRI